MLKDDKSVYKQYIAVHNVKELPLLEVVFDTIFH